MQTQSRADALIAQYIEENPYREGDAGEVWVKDYYVSVWAIVGKLKGYAGDVGRVARAYRIPVEAVQAALEYYAQHEAAIDHRRAQNYANGEDDEVRV